jgi:uncharacterized protein YidB (DUF937 family)
MGLFDNIGGLLSGALQGQSGQGQPSGQGEQPAAAGALSALGGLFQGQGGLTGMLGAFQQAGLGGAVSSWISTGANQGVSPDQIRQVLGEGPVTQFAEKLGVTPEVAAQHISELLPQVVNHLTPNGEPPAPGTDALSNLWSNFKR